MLSINTNISSLIAQQSMTSATNKLNQAIERMTTGYKINGAKDNAANYSISTNMTTKINSYMVAEDNVAMGLDMLSTANGSLDQISDKLTRLRALATQASNGTYGTKSLDAINSEANALVDEIERLYSTAEYNGKKLFSGGNAAGSNGVAAASYATPRAASTNTTYTDEEVAVMKTVTEALNNGAFEEGETYSVSTVEELQILNSECWNYNCFEGVTFVLANDIDLSSVTNWSPIGDDSYRFEGTFDGNGHVISNLRIYEEELGYSPDAIGLFGYIDSGAVIKNLGLENVDIKTECGFIGGLVGALDGGVIENCYVTGSVEGTGAVGGLVGWASSYRPSTISNCYANVTVSGENSVGGLVGDSGITNINNSCVYGDVSGHENVGGFVGECTTNNGDMVYYLNSYASANVTGDEYVGGFIGYAYDDTMDFCIHFTNCYTTSSVECAGYDDGFIGGYNDFSSCMYNGSASILASDEVDQMTAEEIAATYTPEMMGFTEANGWTIVNGQPVLAFSMAARNANAGGLGGSNYVTLQVGINADEHSQIGLEFGFALDGIEGLRQIGLDTSTDYLSTLDNMLDIVTAKATEYGAAQNRLESALDEIAIQYDNLVSSRSTLRDVDIAEVSSLYIQQQILQQASATLLATANQSPSIALQLI